jgi:hypothetical protein
MGLPIMRFADPGATPSPAVASAGRFLMAFRRLLRCDRGGSGRIAAGCLSATRRSCRRRFGLCIAETEPALDRSQEQSCACQRDYDEDHAVAHAAVTPSVQAPMYAWSAIPG